MYSLCRGALGGAKNTTAGHWVEPRGALGGALGGAKNSTSLHIVGESGF